MSKTQSYSNESIRSLKGADRVRLRPGVIFGSDDLEGCIHSFFEILSNSTDEARAGFGNIIKVIKHRDNSITIEDNGRGIPLDYNKKEKKYNWQLIYDEMYAGGKYDENQYKYSLGLNGLGACATQYASKFFNVKSIRDGYEFSISFKEGKACSKLEKKKTKSKHTGTIQTWLPDDKVFTDNNIPSERIIDILKKQAIVNSGVKYTFSDESTKLTKDFLYNDGILEFANEIDGNKGIIQPFIISGSGKGRDRADKPEYTLEVSIAVGFNNKNRAIEYYHNSSFLEHGGAPDKAVKEAFTTSFDKFLRKNNKYQKFEEPIDFKDIEDCLILVSNTFSSETSYENQTKKSITNKFIQEFITRFLQEKLADWFSKDFSSASKVAEQILINHRSRVSAETQRLATKKKLMSKIDIANKVQKFIDCREKSPDVRELFICEGDSAAGAIKQGRDANFQAVMPIRGKILNCAKASPSQILKSDIIMDLIKVMGCGMSFKGKNKDNNGFDINKLRYNKIIILTDSDVDGYHIRTLCVTMIYKLCPQLIEQGYVYIADSPLFEITYKPGTKEEETYFAFTESEKNKYLKGKDLKKIKIQRSKGLGENTPEMMWETTLNPANRHLTKVTLDSVKKAEDSIKLFMGDDIDSRKKYIEKNGHLYLDDLDLD